MSFSFDFTQPFTNHPKPSTKKQKLWQWLGNRHHSKSRRRLRSVFFIALVVVLVAVPSILWFKREQSTSAAWFDGSYGYRKKIPVTNTTGTAQTDFQVELSLDTATLISASKLQSDCEDLRFTDISGKVLSFWTEPNTCNTATTKVFVKVPSIPTSGADIFWYYGNPSANGASQADGAFIREGDLPTVSWPLDDTTATQPYSRAVHPAATLGRNIVNNPGFDSDTLWTKGAGATISNGKANFVASTTSAALREANIQAQVASGVVFEMTFTISNYVSGTINLNGGGGVAGTSRSGNGTYTQYLIPSGGNGLFVNTVGFTGSIDDVSVRQVNFSSSQIAATTLLADGTMESGDTSSWTAINSATLSKQTGTPYAGSQVLRVARNGVSTPGAAQTILTSGSIYRVYGYARSDGSAAPIVRHGTTTIWTGTTSTSWQPFDVVFVSSATDIRVSTSTNTGTQYVEFDNVTVVPDTAIRSGELLQDNTMEASGTGSFSGLNATILSKDTSSPHGGTQALRTTYNGTTVGATQSILAVGKTYRLTGYVRGDGTAIPRVGDAASNTFTGTASSSWQFFDVTKVSLNASLALYCSASSSGQYCEFDDISVTEISPLVGVPTSGVTLGSSSGTGGHGATAYSFDGTNDFVNLNPSIATFNSLFNPNEGTIVAWAKYGGSWTDGSARTIARMYADANNNIEILKDTTNNQVTLKYIAGGTTKSVTISSFSPSTWQQYVISWSKSSDTLKVYINGVQQGSTQTGLGTWVGNIAAVIGVSTGSSTPWSGLINDVRFYNRSLTAEEIAAQYSSTADVIPYTTTNYPGKELFRKYDTRVVVGALATEEVTPGPIAHWKLDDAQGQTAQDSSSNNFDGTLGATSGSSTDDPTWVPEGECVSGNCLRFDGGDFVKVTDHSRLEPTALTAQSWIRTTQTTAYAGIMEKYTGATAGWWLELNTPGYSGKARFGIQTAATWAGAVTTSSPTVNDGKWHLITGTYDGSTLKLFIDGIEYYTQTVNLTIAYDSHNLFIGGDGASTNYFNGDLDEPIYYPYARSAAQVKADYNQGAAKLGKLSRSSLDDGLVGHWRMDESSWTNNCSTDTVLDSSGNSNNGDACPNSTGPTGGAAGKFGLAGSFDGVDDYVAPASSTPLDITNASVSISAWINPTTVAGTYGIAGKANGTIYGYGLYTTTTSLGFGLRAPITQNQFACTTGTGLIAANVWSHVTGTLKDTGSGSIANVYVNGVLVKTCTSVERVGASGSLFAIGARGGLPVGSFFPGKIDEVRVYNRALSDAEVSALASEGTGPVGYWKLDEMTGTTANDSSTNDNSATLTNTPTWTAGKYGGGVDFAGSDQHITRADDADFDFADDADMTVEAFFKHTTASAQEVILSKYNEAGYKIIMESDGDITCALDYDSTWTPTDSVTSTAATYDDNLWHHVACVKSGSASLKLYIDGILIGTDSSLTADNTLTNSDPLYIGIDADGTSNDFVGQIDEVKIYTYARSGGQVIENMNADHPIGGSPIGSYVSYWALDENQGTTANDNSVNGNALTLSTSSWTRPGKINSAWNGVGSNWISRADDDDLDFAAAEDFSLALWFKSDSATNPGATEYLLDKSLSGGTQSGGYAIYAKTTGVICLAIDDDSTWSPDDETCTPSDIYDGNWHHLVARKVGTSSIDIFYDGGFKASDTSLTASTSLANARILYIGDRDGTDNGDEFNGDIDNVKVYRAALTEEQVRIDMNAGASTNYGTTAAAEASTLTDGAGNPPVGEWKLDENTGTAANDTSGNGRTGTLTSGPTWVPGKVGAGIKLDGVDDYVAIADQTAFTPTASGFTVQGWVKYESFETNGSQTRGPLISKTPYAGGADGWEWSLGTFAASSTTTPTFWFVTTDTLGGTLSLAQSSTTAVAGTWYYLVGTVDTNGVARLYVNGVLQATGSSAAFPSDTITPLNIGADYGSSARWDAKGVIDAVKIYNYARTQAQIAYDYNRGAPVAHWKMDECQGSTINDSSGNGYIGTITIGASGTQTSVGTCNTASTAWGNGATGKYNSSINFDGTDDYVDLDAYASSMPTGTSHVTVSQWVKLNNFTGNKTPFGYGGNNNNTGYIFIIAGTTGIPMFQVNGGGAASPFALSTGQWTHLVGTYDRVNIKLYVNGTLVKTQSYAGNNILTATTLRIGNEYLRSYWINGQIDDTRVFNYALSATEVKKLYNDNASVRFGPSTGSP